jgi:hypothetical protein
MIGGEWKVKEKCSLIFDEKKIFSDGKVELENLLKRI